jgi:hypothetical protein
MIISQKNPLQMDEEGKKIRISQIDDTSVTDNSAYLSCVQQYQEFLFS